VALRVAKIMIGTRQRRGSMQVGLALPMPIAGGASVGRL
jgi:hypothetical protein